MLGGVHVSCYLSHKAVLFSFRVIVSSVARCAIKSRTTQTAAVPFDDRAPVRALFSLRACAPLRSAFFTRVWHNFNYTGYFTVYQCYLNIYINLRVSLSILCTKFDS